MLNANRNETQPDTDATAIQAHIAALSDSDVVMRDRSRMALVHMGKPALQPLIEALKDSRWIVRWEAAKALGDIGDPAAIPALIAALDDQRGAIRWLAAEGLMAMGNEAVEPLLQALVICSWDNVWLHEGAHHVLRAQIGSRVGQQVTPVIAALEGSNRSVTVSLAAHRALEALRSDQT